VCDACDADISVAEDEYVVHSVVVIILPNLLASLMLLWVVTTAGLVVDCPSCKTTIVLQYYLRPQSGQLRIANIE